MQDKLLQSSFMESSEGSEHRAESIAISAIPAFLATKTLGANMVPILDPRAF